MGNNAPRHRKGLKICAHKVWALHYARLGWPVVPMHAIENGLCTCGRYDCHSQGKHPRTRHGIKDASTRASTINDWWKTWPHANVAVATGAASDLLVLDVDPRHGGDRSLKKIVKGHKLPQTPIVRTGGGGLHYYFKLPAGIEVKNRTILRGLDVKAEGGAVIAPSSLHRSGKRYRWASGLSPSEVKLASVPSWLKRFLTEPRNKHSQGADADPRTIPEGQRHNSLLRVAGALRRQGMPSEGLALALFAVNETHCMPPLPAEEVQEIAVSAERWEPSPDGPQYVANEGALYWNKTTKDGSTQIKLANFIARIVTDATEDDGVETKRTFEIEAKIGDRTKRFVLPAAQFASMTWPVEYLGARAVVSPGMGLRDHARAAIQELSSRIRNRRIFTHSGWRKYRGNYLYLHSDGAIGQRGTDARIRVQLPNNLSYFTLPQPPNGKHLRIAIRKTLKLLQLGPSHVTIPLFSAVWRSVLGPCDFSLHLCGPTGAGKTELATLNQQFFGAGFDSRHLPGSWSSTGNASEALAFITKDALLVIDDFAPTGTRGDAARYNREADRVLRAQGNASGRQRLGRDATLRSGKVPRGLILSTGEDIPRGQSLRARMFALELSPGALDWKLLSHCQRAAASGLYAQAMSAFLQWLAPRYRTIKKKQANTLSKLRREAANSRQHKRTPEIVANLMLGMRYFLKFAKSVGAISEDEAEQSANEAWQALGAAAKAQNRHQRAEDPVQRFLELIRSALATHRAHLASAGSGRSEDDNGECIGWISENCVCLDPEVAFATAQKLAHEQGEFIPVGQKTLCQRMRDRGLLVRSDAERNLVRKTIGGVRRRVIAIDHKLLGVAVHNRDDRDFGDEQ